MTQVLFDLDFSRWMDYSNVISQMMDAIRSTQAMFLRRVAQKYKTEILDEILSQGTNVTGTYEGSLQIQSPSGGSDDVPTISIVLNPIGAGAERLPIYWKVLEFGARPNPMVPKRAITDWARTKFGSNSVDGFRISNKIRQFGINPHPILQRIFILTAPEGTPIGLTPSAESIAEDEANSILRLLEEMFFTISKTGQIVARIPAGQPGGGRFTSPNR